MRGSIWQVVASQIADCQKTRHAHQPARLKERSLSCWTVIQEKDCSKANMQKCNKDFWKTGEASAWSLAKLVATKTHALCCSDSWYNLLGEMEDEEPPGVNCAHHSSVSASYLQLCQLQDMNTIRTFWACKAEPIFTHLQARVSPLIANKCSWEGLQWCWHNQLIRDLFSSFGGDCNVHFPEKKLDMLDISMFSSLVQLQLRRQQIAPIYFWWKDILFWADYFASFFCVRLDSAELPHEQVAQSVHMCNVANNPRVNAAWNVLFFLCTTGVSPDRAFPRFAISLMSSCMIHAVYVQNTAGQNRWGRSRETKTQTVPQTPVWLTLQRSRTRLQTFRVGKKRASEKQKNFSCRRACVPASVSCPLMSTGYPHLSAREVSAWVCCFTRRQKSVPQRGTWNRQLRLGDAAALQIHDPGHENIHFSLAFFNFHLRFGKRSLPSMGQMKGHFGWGARNCRLQRWKLWSARQLSLPRTTIIVH